MNVTIQRIDKSLPLPAYHSVEAAAFDVYSRLDITIAPGEIARIPTNLIIATPPGYALVIALRSSTPRRKGLAHPAGIGIVDPDYRGPEDEVMVQVQNISGVDVKIERGERIGQGMFVATPRVTFTETDEPMSEKSRGGFGTTGTNV